MGRTNKTGRRIGIFCAGVFLCGLMGLTGGMIGARLAQYFQPRQEEGKEEITPESDSSPVPGWHNEVMEAGYGESGEATELPADTVISIPDILQADTEYILREKDLVTCSEIETSEEI
ncbi:MAG: hypothetical protein K2O34_09255, partial [Acetatifactor sp.]|nr:hypothetical protein [Acetatifactor sp.]